MAASSIGNAANWLDRANIWHEKCEKQGFSAILLLCGIFAGVKKAGINPALNQR